MRNILIIDDTATPSLTAKSLSYPSFLSAKEANLFLITTKGAVPKHEQKKYRGFVELKSVCSDGLVELIAKAWHEKFTLHEIYCKQEDLLIRAAALRAAFKITTGLQPESVAAFRVKNEMKEIVAKQGFPVPKFKSLNSPCCLLEFVEEHGLPVVVKPILGSASAGVHVLWTQQHVVDFLSNDYFKVQDAKGQHLDVYREWIVESYLDAPMYHVNGFVENGKIIHLWPFQNIATNYHFTQGHAYGNVSLPPTDPDFQPLCKATRALLSCFNLPSRFVFHAELFKCTAAHQFKALHLPTTKPRTCFALCEIAARRPGSSIPSLITRLLRSAQPAPTFDQLEFRFLCGLPIPRIAQPTVRVADLLVPNRPHSLLTYLPPRDRFPLASYVEYHPLARPGSVYDTFRIDVLNTLARFVTSMEANDTLDAACMALMDAQHWLERHCVFLDLPPGGSDEGVLARTAPRVAQMRRHCEKQRAQGMQVSRVPHGPGFTLLRHVRTRRWTSTALVPRRTFPLLRVVQRTPHALIRVRPWMAIHRRLWRSTRHHAAANAAAPAPRIHVVPAATSTALVSAKDIHRSRNSLLHHVHAKFGQPEWKEGKRYVLVSSSSAAPSSSTPRRGFQPSVYSKIRKETSRTIHL